MEDFEDLSPLDQKALLRRTVSELVMLGFARASIAYEGTVCEYMIIILYIYIYIYIYII